MQWVGRVVGFAIASLEVIVGIWVVIQGSFARGGLATRAACCRSTRHGERKKTMSVKEWLSVWQLLMCCDFISVFRRSAASPLATALTKRSDRCRV